MDYVGLQTLIARRLKREDLAAFIPDYIRLAEARLSTSLRARELEQTYSVTTVAGINTVALPSDYFSLKNVQVTGTYNTPLSLIPDDTLLEYSVSNYQGSPSHYTIQGSNLLLYPIPDSEYTVSMVYYQTLPSLTNETTSNWLLEKAPDVYLYGSLVEGCLDTQDFELLQIYEPRFKEAIDRLWDAFSIESFSGSPLRAVSSYVV